MRDRYAQCDETCTADCGACKGARRRCRSCLQLVDVYRPTGTRVLRAAHHHDPPDPHCSTGHTCPGSYGPTDDPREQG